MAENSGVTLTQFMDYSRKFLVLGAVVLVVMMVVQLAISLYQNSRTTPSIYIASRATMGYGYLPAISFPISTTLTTPTSYTLNYNGTNDSRYLPRFGVDNNIAIYLIPDSPYSLLADRQARTIATGYGFTGEPQSIGNRLYRFFTNDGVLDKQLEIDLKTFSVELTTNYLSHGDFLQGAGDNKSLPDRTTAINTVRDFLVLGGLLPDDLVTTAARADYVKAVGNRVEMVDTFYEADYLAVSLPRAPLEDSYQYYGPDNHSSIYAIVARDSYGEDYIVYLKDFYRHTDLTSYETYPLRGTAEAWQIVQMGGAYIASMGRTSNVVVSGVALGYYEDINETDYLQPVYVFTSTDGFVAYVQAVDPRVIDPEQ